MGAHMAQSSEDPGRTGQAGLEPGVPGWKFRPSQKGGEDVDYGWKGKGSTVHMMTEGEGLPLAFDVTGASVSEVTVGLDVVDRVRVPRARGRPKKRPDSLAADKSYDSAEFRPELRRRGIRPSVPQRHWPGRKRTGRPPKVYPVSTCRWKVERTHGWLDNWRRLVVRYDRHTDVYIAFLTYRLPHDHTVKDFGIGS